MEARMSNEAVIVAAARTPIGKAPRGSLRHTRPDDLAAMSIQAVLARCPAVDPSEIEDVIFGCATPEGESGMNIARVAALRAGLPQSTPGATVNRFCASGLEAVAIAAERIRAGDAEVILAGGVESMSRVPFLDIRTHPNPTLFRDAPNTYLSMGLSVEQLARKYGITREQADAFALQSHQKAVRAQDEGLFDAEIAPVQTEVQTVDACGRPQREAITLTHDEGPRRDTSMESLAKLKPAFRADGIITAGNASQRSDGAAAVLVMRARKADALGVKPLLRFVGYTTAALTPEDFGVAPAYAIPKLLRRTGVWHRRDRPHRVQRGVRGAGAGVELRFRDADGAGEPAGRCDSAGASAGLHGCAAGRHAGVRAATHGRTLRSRHDVRRAGHGRGRAV
jgi:acetyl-CoA acyltransferase